MSQVKRNIPYQVIGGTPFWLRKEVKDVMAYVKLAINPEDNLSLMRAINQPTRGIGHESQAKLKAWAEAQGLTLGRALFPNFQVGLHHCSSQTASGQPLVSSFSLLLLGFCSLYIILVSPQHSTIKQLKW